MIVVLRTNVKRSKVDEVAKLIKGFGYEPRVIFGVERTVIACIGDERTHHTLESLVDLPEVESVMPVQKKYKLVSRQYKKASSVVRVGDLEIGGKYFHVIAGPCSVETEKQTIDTAKAVKAAGATLFRGGAFKPRTSPYDFQGLGHDGLEILKKARATTGLPIVTEVMSPDEVEEVCEFADVLQIGARNCQNYALLRAVGQTRKPVLLKRGMSQLVQEWLLAAEYVCAGGNDQVILCERGIRTYETSCRNTFDVSAIAVAKKETHLPVFADPSHAAGRADMVAPLARAAAAVGADGLIVEVHPKPVAALSDDAQQIDPPAFAAMMKELKPILAAVGKRLA